MWQIQNTIMDAGNGVERFLQPLLQNLDPSLFQNIILGILAIFIPFAIVFLTDILNSKKEGSEFEKMVLSVEVLGAGKVFWLSVFGVYVLAFFSGKDITVLEKLIAILITLFLVLVLGKFFKKTLQFSEGYKPEFAISFLKSLNLSKILRFGNNLKMERMVRAWNSFWSKRSAYNEREFTQAFIKHIDDAVESKRYGLAVSLAQTYQNNLDKRDGFSIGYEVLPKLFEWHEKFWEAQQEWLNKRSYEEKIQKVFSSKYFPTFKKWALILIKKVYGEDNFFWNWHYFQQEFFLAVAKVLLYDGHGPYQLFTCFKKHIDETEAKLEKIESEDRKQKLWSYIEGLFRSFCPMFFENIDSVSSKYEVWEHYFPVDWKVTVANSENRFSRIILNEFLQWAQQRVFKKDGVDYDKDLTEVVEGIFPNAHPSLFPAFLMLLLSAEIKYAVQKEPSFFITGGAVTWSGEKNDEEIQQMFDQREQSRKEETISMIFGYFGHWRLLKLYKDDVTEKESSDWSGYSEEQRKLIVNRVRKAKLQGTLDELNGVEIIDLCKESERREYQRNGFIELIQLLLERIP